MCGGGVVGRHVLKRQGVSANAVEEPAVVGNDHSRAGEGEKRVFESPESLYVQIVGWLINRLATGHMRKQEQLF